MVVVDVCLFFNNSDFQEPLTDKKVSPFSAITNYRIKMRSDRLENQSLHVPLKHFNKEILVISETNRPKL